MLGFLAAYREPRLLAVLFMGFASGLPLALTGATLTARFTDAHVALTAIGLTSLIQLSYNLKPFWAPALDRVPIPLLTSWLGQRRSWLVLLAMTLIPAIAGLGLADPIRQPVATVIWAILVAFLSASQDVVIDAYRVEILRPVQQGAGAAVTQYGYRFGMLASGAGALAAASFWGWPAAYEIMAALMLAGVIIALLSPEPALPAPEARRSLGASVAAPFRDLLLRRGWPLLFAFVLLYKLGDAMSGHMAMPFFLGLGFSKIDVATISKMLGMIAGIIGIGLGGIVVYRFGIFRALLFCGVLQMAANGLYVVQDLSGNNLLVLAATITLENLATGMGGAAFVAYLSDLCSPGYAATQYALLSALALLGRNLFASVSGWLAVHLGWIGFFILAMGLGLPGLLLLVWMMRRSALSPARDGVR